MLGTIKILKQCKLDFGVVQSILNTLWDSQGSRPCDPKASIHFNR